MAERIPIASAKTVKDLKTISDKVKTESKGYGFTSVANLREEVVGKAMTDKKKPADFIVEVEIKDKIALVQLSAMSKAACGRSSGERKSSPSKITRMPSWLAKFQSFKDWTKKTFANEK